MRTLFRSLGSIIGFDATGSQRVECLLYVSWQWCLKRQFLTTVRMPKSEAVCVQGLTLD